jgi:hypothetical protein
MLAAQVAHFTVFVFVETLHYQFHRNGFYS